MKRIRDLFDEWKGLLQLILWLLFIVAVLVISTWWYVVKVNACMDIFHNLFICATLVR